MRKMFRELLPFKGQIALIFASVIGGVYATLALPNYLSDIINVGITNADMGYILRIGLFMLGFTLLSAVCNVIMGFLAARVSMGFGRTVRSKVFSKVQGFSLAEIDRFSTSSLINRTNNDIMQVQNFMMMFLRVILMAPIMCIAGITLALQKSVTMSSVLIVSMPVLFLLIVFIARKAVPLSKAIQKKIDRINLVLREKLTGLRVIRAFDTEEFEAQRFAQANGDLMQTSLNMQRTMSALMPTLMLVLNLTVVALLWFGGRQVPSGAVLTGDIIAIIQYVMQIMMSVTMLSMIFVMYPRASASADRINEVLDTQPNILAPKSPKNSTAQKGTLEFDHVTFRFEGAPEPAIRSISFTARPGTTTAVIGSTGSGKSALVGLIPRFYDVQEGSVRVGGIDVRDYEPDVLRRKIGYVPQKALLFRGDIESNIRFGDESADHARVEEAARIAQSHDFITAKEEGFHSPIGQGGSNVSGGQRQRLAIARAIVRKPEIYVFDDSFSALDFKTDSRLREALSEQTKDAAVIIVAQRVSTIMGADQILVLDDGNLMGIGTHHELLESCETYREIVQSQLSKEEMGA